MTALVERLAAQPGVYDRISDAEYHRDQALSSTGARKLLAPSCPAAFRWWADNPQPPKLEYDLGHAAHRELLGAGPELVIVDAPDWRKADARAAKEEAYAAGRTPLLAHQYVDVLAMIAAVRAHPVAGRLFQPEHGRSEVSCWWDDPETGVRCRSRFDYLPEPVAGRPLLVADYKTSTEGGSAPTAAGKSMASYGYHQQGAWYLDAAVQCGLTAGQEAAFLLVFQERAAPYLVTTFQLPEAVLRRGAVRNRKARHRYAECFDRGEWPDHGAGQVQWLDLPRWAEVEHDIAEDRGDFDINPRGTQ